MSLIKAPAKRNLAPENADWQPSIEDQVEEQTNKTQRIFLNTMDALAYGIEARYELNTGHSRRVTEETAAIARELGVPEDEIEGWTASRLSDDMEKLRVIKSLLKRLEGFPLASVNRRHLRGMVTSQSR